MPSSYPSGLDSFTTKVNGQVIQASHMNNVQDPIVAIETVIGVTPTTISDTTTPGATPTFLGGYISGGSIGFASMVATQLRLITGGAAWWTLPVTTLAALNTRLGLPTSPVTGDMVYYNGTAWVRLAIGATGQLLDVIGGLPSWQTITAGGVGAIPAPASPETGDLLYYNGANWVRLPIGTLNQALLVQGGIPTWVSSPPGTLADGMWTYYNAGSTRVDLKLRSPAVVASNGTVTEYANIQNAINTATSGQWVVIPPGTYNEPLTLKAGVIVAELISGTVKLQYIGGPVVTTISGGFLKVDSIVNPGGAMGQLILSSHSSGTCTIVTRLLQNDGAGVSASNPYAVELSGDGELDLIVDTITMTLAATTQPASYAIYHHSAATLWLICRQIVMSRTVGNAATDALHLSPSASCSINLAVESITITASTASPLNALNVLSGTGTTTLAGRMGVVSLTSTGSGGVTVFTSNSTVAGSLTLESSTLSTSGTTATTFVLSGASSTLTLIGGIHTLSGSSLSIVVTVSGGTLTTQGMALSGNGTVDIKQTGGTLNIYACQYDFTKTSGTLTFLTGDRMRPAQQRLFAQVFSN